MGLAIASKVTRPGVGCKASSLARRLKARDKETDQGDDGLRIGGLLCLDCDLGDAAGLVQREVGEGTSPRSDRANCVKISVCGVSGSARGGLPSVMRVTFRSTNAVSMTPRVPAMRRRSSPWVGADSGRR